ncbi:O-linked N-acetylglucosamine transferase, SPINDLY family protein [Allochromatium vinosum]|uniref:protein O-GlcNAc transferase n=1 Tax=Allochromatium vinosum (strain ATCC 17899 / DSM 180 / NBRC 103801 / NCIMB 10441 / D) TaxID=572477 RepID=D3RUL3_ALLVD|nr:tetratricopeptide repeat protein [Allochromatium vinosum]ADC62872.1 Tetratricopeptide TPR_2 repeat protein [Allochromatium vinosum DSM 180]
MTHGKASKDDGDDLLALFEQGRHADAEIKARLWTENYPHDAFGWKILGAILTTTQRHQEAVSVLKTALKLSPEDAECLNTLGAALEDEGRMEEAGVLYARAARQAPGFVAAFYNLAKLLQRLGRLDEARFYFEHALSINPLHLKSLNNLGSLLRDLGCTQEALDCYRRALAIHPSQPEALTNLGNLLLSLGQLHEALECQQRAARLQPGHPEILSNLGNALQHLGRLDEALDVYRQALTIRPDDTSIHGKLLFTLNYHPDQSAEQIFSAYQAFDQRIGVPYRASWQPPASDRDPDRRLRIGYVSPDFRCHSIRHFLEPVLAHHDHQSFEITAYAELSQEDGLTAVYRRLVDRWVPTHGLSDDVLAERIRADGIDILIDLAGHTGGNRLGVFARRPTPVSVTWMGYGYTTGLSAIDYFLTDAIMAPAGCEPLFAERPWRLEAPSGIYRPASDMGEVGSLPALANGTLTFGTLTRHVRLNHHVIRVWSEILRRLPHARLIIDSKDFATEAVQARLAERFAAHGIEPERLSIGYHSPPWDVLRTMDIGLDCFPHNSGATLVESLYMGVPFITLAARPSVGRSGSSVLTGAGHPEWIATSEADYVNKAVALASDLEHLAALRARLRADFEASPWRDEAGFVQRIERAYRNMWQHWCESAPAGQPADRLMT